MKQTIIKIINQSNKTNGEKGLCVYKQNTETSAKRRVLRATSLGNQDDVLIIEEYVLVILMQNQYNLLITIHQLWSLI